MEPENRLLTEILDVVSGNSVLSRFLGSGPGVSGQRVLERRSLPIVPLLPELIQDRSPLIDAIVDSRDAFHWRQSYHENEVGAHYLRNYGWFDVASPDGPLVSETIRISVGFYNEGLYYPRHWHEPEEVYYVIWGGAEFHSEGRQPRKTRAGDVVQHESNQPHSINMKEGPLLAFTLFKGCNLTRKPKIEKR